MSVHRPSVAARLATPSIPARTTAGHGPQVLCVGTHGPRRGRVRQHRRTLGRWQTSAAGRAWKGAVRAGDVPVRGTRRTSTWPTTHAWTQPFHAVMACTRWPRGPDGRPSGPLRTAATPYCEPGPVKPALSRPVQEGRGDRRSGGQPEQGQQRGEARLYDTETPRGQAQAAGDLGEDVGEQQPMPGHADAQRPQTPGQTGDVESPVQQREGEGAQPRCDARLQAAGLRGPYGPACGTYGSERVLDDSPAGDPPPDTLEM
jgi:hypothetical protein